MKNQISIHQKLENIGKHSGRVPEFRTTLLQYRIDPFLFFYEKNNHNRNYMVKYKTLAQNIIDNIMVNYTLKFK